MFSVSERKAAYALLSQLFVYPDQELLSVLRSGNHAGWLSRLDVLAPPLDELSVLEENYTGLFINRLGGIAAPPYGSVYLEPEGTLMGETTLAVSECYREFGLALEGTVEPPDFLSTELEFLYFLVEMEEAALQAGAGEVAEQAFAQQAEFARSWVFPWIGVFCEKLTNDSQTHPFYLWCTEVLQRFCRQEQDSFNRVLPA